MESQIHPAQDRHGEGRPVSWKCCSIKSFLLLRTAGPLDHDGWVKSIYFFDPNGARLELTTVTGAEKEADYRAKARAELDAWTREKKSGTGP